MKKIVCEFILEYYENFIYEDWSVLTKFGVLYNKWAWFIRAIIMWILSPLYVIPFFIKRTDMYKEFHKNLIRGDM